ncbi:dynactin p62 family-domain-containing protein [Thelephora terrestris]|uniref:Dynactin subunit 4 n=1 Tax=Thelephora terrestris TaxID=56493 RepID=A0A9P6L5J1_9AGAM|nr:dynactin p62 family-domain-containing protein [Thelephora terrestris]
MSAPSLKIYCPCLDPNSLPPPPNLPSSSHSYHEIHDLYFCEECDLIRCNRCVSVEVSGYYCPNCLFEVPSASVRGEKNRCARNCFLCPSCKNTLIVVPSDPPESADGRIMTINTLGDPPFFLYCSHCRWDSAEVGITFEKPTSLANQLQKHEDSAPDSLEFERLKEHFEPFIRASSASSSASHHLRTAQHVHSNPITAAASDALSRDVPGVSKYNPLSRSRVGRDKSNRDEMPEYRSRMDVSLTGSDTANVQHLLMIESPDEIATLEQRWINSWTSSVLVNDLKPLRIPLHSKKSKRCPTCRHILIKPEQKPQSVRFKIKIAATGYLPLMAISLPFLNNNLATTAKRSTRPGATWEEDRNSPSINPVMFGGRTYPFVLSFTNPMYDPIQIRINALRSPVSTTTVQTDETGPAQPEKRRPPFAITLPTYAFSVAAFAEAWEYDEDDDMIEDEHADLVDDRRHASASTNSGPARGGKAKTVGVLEKKANTTFIGGEVVIGKEAQGDVKFLTMVTFTYRNDTVDEVDLGDEDGDGSPVRTTNPSSSVLGGANKQPEIRTFSYYVVVDLGRIAQRNVEGSIDERR